MRRLLAILLFATLGVAPAPAGHATAPRWTVPIDSRTVDQWLVEDGHAVYGPRDGRLIALDMRTGKVLWRSEVAVTRRSAVHDGVVAAPTKDGLVFVSARDGRVLRKAGLGSEPLVASSQAGFASVTKAGRSEVDVRGWDDRGALRWTKRYDAPFGKLLMLGGDAIGLTFERNGRVLVLDARDGKAVAQTDGIDELIGADGRYLWFNVIGGGIKGLDLDTTQTLALHGSVVRGAARVEHGVAVAVVDGRLQSMDLRRNRITPLHVDGRWVGGPSAGRIFIERGDGMYVQGISEGRARRVATYRGESRLVAADGRVGMIAMEDGLIHVVDVVEPRPLATIATPCRDYEGFAESDGTTLVHCDGDANVSMLLAFPRYARSLGTQ